VSNPRDTPAALARQVARLARAAIPGAAAVVREVERELKSVATLADLGLAAVAEVKGALARVTAAEPDEHPPPARTPDPIRVTPAPADAQAVRPKVTIREPQPGDTVAAWLRKQRQG
jgi:hypothetical protein